MTGRSLVRTLAWLLIAFAWALALLMVAATGGVIGVAVMVFFTGCGILFVTWSPR